MFSVCDPHCPQESLDRLASPMSGAVPVFPHSLPVIGMTAKTSVVEILANFFFNLLFKLDLYLFERGKRERKIRTIGM